VFASIHVARVLAGVLPAVLVVLALFIVATIALILGSDRRAYALDVADRLIALAGVLVGFDRNLLSAGHSNRHDWRAHLDR
jgi:hypothetical protein